MKKTKKTLASLAIAGMVMTMLPFNAFATPLQTDRLAGNDRYQTAVAVANQGWTSADTAIICSGNDANLVDALAVAPFAGEQNAPILLTDNNSLNSNTKAELTKLGVKKAYVIGAVQDSVASEINAMGIQTEVIRGNSRIDTANAITAKLKNPAGTFVVGYNAISDAMSIASYAVANNYAIELTAPDGTVDTSKLVGSKTYIIGGSAVVKDSPGIERVAGNDRFDTNEAVLSKFNYNYQKVYVANGMTLVDALVASSLAGKDKAPILLSDGVNVKPNSDITTKLSSTNDFVALGGTAVIPDSVISQVTGQTTNNQSLSVESVTAISPTTLKVTFNVAPQKTSDVTFDVKMGTTPMTLTATWDSATTATLTSSSDLPQGTYSIDVKDGENDLGTKNVDITAQKIGKISFTSNKLGVTQDGKGYASYQVLDQYGNDITTSYLANNIEFQCGVGTVTAKDGVLTIAPSSSQNSLMQFPSVAITAYDTTSGVSANATLTTSTALGTLSNFKLNKLSGTLTAQDISDTWDIDYSATDLSGNTTQKYDLIKNGLILGTNNAGDNALTTSDPDVMANLIQDPNDSTNAIIQVTVSNNSIPMNMPVTITAMTYAGTSSTLNVTLNKQSATDSFTLEAPSENVTVGEQFTIPFVAYDQNGVQLTKYSDLTATNVTFTPSSVHLSENADGTASLVAGPFNTKGQQMITAVTPTGKYSTLTLNIMDTAYADSLTLDSGVLINAMQAGATQKVDFGWKYGGFVAKDQYGRVIDMTNNPGNYEVVPVTSGNVTASGAAYGGQPITISASDTPGQGTITFNLVDKTNPSQILASTSAIFSVVPDNNITGYAIDSVSSPIYAVADDTHTTTTLTGRESKYSANPYVYGTTNGGSKVVLAGTPILNADVTNTTDFIVDTAPAPSTEGAFPADYQGVYVTAKQLSNNVTTSNTTLTVTLKGADGLVHTVTTPINSSTTTPNATSVNAVINATTSSGITVNKLGDQFYYSISQSPDALGVGKILTKFDQNGNIPSAGRAGVTLYAVDQYGTKAEALASVYAQSTLNSGDQFTVDSDGTITASKLSAGDVITLTGVASNGVSKSVKINVVD